MTKKPVLASSKWKSKPELVQFYDDHPWVLALNYKCRHCGAKRGSECVTESGRPVQRTRIWANDLSEWFTYPGVHAIRTPSRPARDT